MIQPLVPYKRGDGMFLGEKGKYPKLNRKTCIGCGRCEISCLDGGHQAIHLDGQRRPILDAKKCVGCHLCVLVCPTDSIGSSGKRICQA